MQLNIQIRNVMMQLVSSNGTVLLEREKPSTKRANTNKDGKTTFQFFDERSDKVDYRTPSEGGVEL